MVVQHLVPQSEDPNPGQTDLDELKALARSQRHLAREAVSSMPTPECNMFESLVASAGDTLRDFDAVALHLLLERKKGEASDRWAHLDELPKAYDSTLFWSEAELKELEGSS